MIGTGVRAARGAPELGGEKRRAVGGAVVAWYRRGHRELPWRATRDPYAIVVSEIMLQQTQVDRVLPKFVWFMERYPTLESLAAASRAEVIRDWSPLGYNLRAVRLHEIARQAVERFGGTLPDTLEGLLSLKGIGPYTAAAVLCFAYGQPVALLDTNVRRVLGRIYTDEAPGATEDDRLAWPLAQAALPDERVAQDVYDWNQALMDLGATVCLSRTPRCAVCPAATWCAARQAWYGAEAQLVVQAGLPLVAESRAVYVAGEPAGQGNGAAGAAGPAASAASAASAPANGVEKVVRTAGTAKAAKVKTPTKPTERFEGSRRWYRGRIVDALRAAPAGQSLGLEEVRQALLAAGAEAGKANEALLRDVLAALHRDGLVEVMETAEGVRASLPQNDN